MNAQRDERLAGNGHAGVWELLPWYANGTLSAEEDRRVEQHVVACPLCHDELERCRRLAESVKSTDEKAWAPSPAHFADAMVQIDRAEARREAVPKEPVSLGTRVREWLSDTRRLQWAFAVQGALVLVMAGALFLTIHPTLSPYETLSRPAERVAANRAQLRVLFAEDVTGKELRDMLQGVDAQIVRGPSPTGVYTIELPFASTEQESTKSALATLRSYSKVQLAEPAGDAQ